MTDLAELFAQLTREPDLDAPELQAHDATDRLLLQTAAADGHRGEPDTAEPGSAEPGTGGLVVIGDRHGALTLGAIAGLSARGVRVFQDPLLGERALAANAARLGLATEYANHQLDASLLTGARLVLLQLPRSLAELDEIAQAVARWADPAVTLLAGGRVKHMTRAMNEVLARSFGEVSAGLAERKSRVLTARSPLASRGLGDPRFPVWGRDPDLPFAVAAFGATFGGAALDHGSRLLLRGLADAGWPAADRIVDLGCGGGVLAVSAALARPSARVIASDQSAAAVAATRLTAEAAGVVDRVEVHRADATEAVPEGWADLILLNPPFHTGATVHAGVAHRLIRSCARALAPGGELRLVFNSHLGYRPLIERVIGPSRQIARDRTFTVLAAVRSSERDSARNITKR
ncbi:MAG: class I SAM-dependent methyltransferase [Leucobacter sp.]